MTDRATLSLFEELLARELDGRRREDLDLSTPEGVALKPLYTRADLEGLEFAESCPGAPPFVRGPYASMYLGRPWTVRQYAGFSTAEASNAFYRRSLAAGQLGLSVAFDLATHRGYDSDHERVAGDVGKAGVAIDSVEDMKRLFEGIPLERTSVSMTMNGAVLPVLAAYIVAAEEQGVLPHALAGTIQNDILKEFMVRNTYIYPPRESMRIVADIIEYGSAHMPRFNTVSVSGYHMHEAGAPADLELGYTLADGLEYVRCAVDRGLSVDAFAPRISFFFAVGMNLYMEVAKLRAARLLWCALMQQHFAPQKPESLRLRTHCQTSGVSLTAQDPYNNVVRTTVEALAAVMGGTQSLHTNAFDEALALPSDAAARLARNTQLILSHEAGLTRTVDPWGGSYFMEALTQALADRARGHIERVLALGGMTQAVAQGIPQTAIQEAAARRQARLDRGLDVLVGVNRYRAETEEPLSLRVIDNREVREQQVARLAALRQGRDQDRVRGALEALGAVARSEGNLLTASIEAMRARATVGEVSLALEQVFGRFQSHGQGVGGVYSSYYEGDENWQALQREVQRFVEAQGRPPRLLVAKLGQDGHDRGAKVIAAGLSDLGFDVDLGPLFQTPVEVARAAIDNDVHLVGISTQAGAHSTLVPELIERLREQNASDVLVVCGGIIPKADHPALEAAGVSAIFEPGTPLPAVAQTLLELLRDNAPHDPE
ncbi:MAG TPA: methylmalonyl-CoA mutase [Polyangiaceae bacterium]